jgi:hypothetical protein
MAGAPSAAVGLAADAEAGGVSSAIPDVTIPALREYLPVFVRDEPGALLFGAEGRAAATRQLQQDVRLAAGGADHRHGGPALPRPETYR